MSFFINNNAGGDANRRVRMVIWGDQALEYQAKIHIMQVRQQNLMNLNCLIIKIYL